MNKKLNHAIIGCGRVAQNHYNAAIKNGFKVEFCYDLDLEKAKNFAEKNNIKNYSNNYLEVLQNEKIDSVSICTDHKSHTEIAQMLLDKKHLIIEKPFSTNLKNAKKFVKSIKNTNKKVSVIAQHRFDDVVNTVKALIEDNAFGKITLVNANLICFRDVDYYSKSYWRGTLNKEGGSTIINQAFHIVDTLVYLFGIPKKVKTFKNNFSFKNIIETEDTCVSILNYDNFLCTLSSTNTSIQDWSTSIKIVGTKGNITFNIDFPEEITELNISNELKNKYNKQFKTIEKNHKKNLDSPVNYYGLSHIRQFENFKNAILENSTIKVGTKEALQTQSVIDMIYKG